MLLKKARVRQYRSIRDTGLFDVEESKTILIGPNEAGKTAVLEALQKINADRKWFLSATGYTANPNQLFALLHALKKGTGDRNEELDRR